MKIFVDENIPLMTVAALRAVGDGTAGRASVDYH